MVSSVEPRSFFFNAAPTLLLRGSGFDPASTAARCVFTYSAMGTKFAAIERGQVRKTPANSPSWPRNWAKFSLSLALFPHESWANLHVLGQPDIFLAPALQQLRQRAGGRPAAGAGLALDVKAIQTPLRLFH
jgi:hypothetical protein